MAGRWQGAYTGETRESSGARHPDGEADSEHLRIGRAENRRGVRSSLRGERTIRLTAAAGMRQIRLKVR